MAERTKPPSLFAWGDDGVPGEFESYLRAHEERGENMDTVHDAFAGTAVVRMSENLLMSVRTTRDRNPKDPPKLRSTVADMVYLLHAYCAKWAKPAPPALLWLTFESLGLKEGAPAPETALSLDVPGQIEKGKHAAFFKASRLDGEARAAKIRLSQSKLAKKVGVSAKTIRRWRQDEYYIRRQAVIFIQASGKRVPMIGRGNFNRLVMRIKQ